MAPPPLPDSTIRQAAALYQTAIAQGYMPLHVRVGTGRRSAVTYVAEHLSRERSTAFDILRRAETLGYLGEYTPPSLPSEDLSLDKLIRRRAEEQARTYAHREAAEWMRFTVHGDEPFALAFVGDPHVDVCDIARLCDHMDLIERTERMWAVGLGDWINGWVGKLRAEYAHQPVTERQAYQLAQWLFQKPFWWLLILGNHDGQRWHGQGSPLRWMETACATPVQEWQVKFSIACGGASWKVWAAHNFPGNSQFNAGHGPKKRALWTGAEADIYIAGDRHTFTCQEDQHEHTGRVFWTARARGYKPLDHYALEHGHGDAGGRRGVGQSIGAVFDPRDRSVVCFSDLQKAADFLATLRGKPRVRVKAA